MTTGYWVRSVASWVLLLYLLHYRLMVGGYGCFIQGIQLAPHRVMGSDNGPTQGPVRAGDHLGLAWKQLPSTASPVMWVAVPA